jgi:hypothetical protein
MPAQPTSDVTPVPVHRIGVRVVDGVGEFFVTTTGERFVPRGMNYNRFLPAASLGGLADNAFTTRYYDPSAVESDLSQMEGLGFNSLRVMIDTCDPADGCIATGPAGRELNPAYIDNLADFLRRAADHGMAVMVSSNTLPDDSYWLNESARTADAQFQSANNEFLNPVTVPLYVDYWTKVVRALIERGAPTDAIWAYELRQEHHFQAAFAPFTLTSGAVTTANGSTYDMADPTARERMVDEGLVYWTDLLRSAIRDIDPTALVTVGFFTPNAPNAVMDPSDTRLVRTAYFLRNTTADFADLHHYPGNGVHDADVWENFGLIGVERLPLVLGEFGAYRAWWSGPAAGAAAVMGLQVGACQVGFDGYLVWAWRGDQASDMWWATDGNREIARVVSPQARPDPCQPGQFDFVRYNVATLATVSASSALPAFPASNVNDGTAAHWNAANPAPGFVELTLASPAAIDAIVLTVAQDPAGQSTHELWVRRTGGRLERVHVFRGITHEGQILTFEPTQPLTGVELVRVVTTRLGNLAPAWHEIELLSSTPPAE